MFLFLRLIATLSISLRENLESLEFVVRFKRVLKFGSQNLGVLELWKYLNLAVERYRSFDPVLLSIL